MKTKRILVVEDEQDLLELYEHLLTDEGYEVRTSQTGVDTFDIITQFQPELVLMDINLGKLNGAELGRDIKLKPDTENIKVILISGEDHISEAMTYSHADGFFPKPFDVHRLLAKVRDLAR